jgi:general secretion pathway protein E
MRTRHRTRPARRRRGLRDRGPAAGIAAVLLVCGAPAEVLAADWPPIVLREPGGGIAILPALIWWLLVLGWVATTDWLCRDGVKQKRDTEFWSMVLAFPFFVVSLLAWWIPWAWLGMFLMGAAWIAPMAVYASKRNEKLPPSQKILTLGHFMRLVSGGLERLGLRVKSETPPADALVPTVVLAADPAAAADQQAQRLEKASAAAGFKKAVDLLAELAGVGGMSAAFELTGNEVPLRQEIDGVWHQARAWQSRREKLKVVEEWVPAPPLARPEAESIREALLLLCGLEPRQQRARQEGTFAAKVDGKPWKGTLTSRPSSAGERVVVRFEPQAFRFKTFGDLGMSDELAEKVANFITLENGLILISSPPESGGSTAFDVTLGATDRLLRDFVSIEDKALPPREIQNIKPFRWDAAAGVSPAQALAKAALEYPKAIVTRDLDDKELASALVERATGDQLVIVGLKAADSIAAIERLLALGVDREKLAGGLLGSLSLRLVRKPCVRCRQEVPPSPEFLKRIRLTPERLPTIIQASKAGCRLCNGTGYRGRVGLFELASGKTLRQAITVKPDRETLQKAAVKDGMRAIMDAAGYKLVVEGQTTLEELRRVLSPQGRAEQPSASRRPSSSASGSPPTSSRSSSSGSPRPPSRPGSDPASRGPRGEPPSPPRGGPPQPPGKPSRPKGS